MIKDSQVKTYHVFTLYALFIDVVSYCVQNNTSLNTLYEARRLHNDIYRNVGTSVLKLTLNTLRGV